MGILIFIFVLSVLIVFHEWGHYYAAKRLGIRVERFSIGFGPLLFKVKPKETEFCVSLFPLGGYVKMAGEGPQDSTGAAHEFHTRPNWHKFIVVFAGPLLNALLAVVLFSATFVIGQPNFTPRVGLMKDGYPAQIAGLKENDLILEINGVKLETWEDLLKSIRENESDVLSTTVDRNGAIMEFALPVRISDDKDVFGKQRKTPQIGIMPQGEAQIVKMPFTQAVPAAFNQVMVLSGQIIGALGKVISGQDSFKDTMAGPIGIYKMTNMAYDMGWVHLLDFMGRLSVSLWIINLFPIPVLDGGHLFFILIETVIRRPISDRIKDLALRIGIVLVLALTFYVLYQDIINFGYWDKLKGLLGM